MDIIEEDYFKPPIMDLTCEEEQKMDDDLDFALAYCLQTDFDEDPVPDNSSNKSFWSELKDDSKIESGASSQSWNSVKNVKRFKAEQQENADYMLALKLQAEENEKKLSSHGISGATSKPLNQIVNHVKPGGSRVPASIVDPEWEVLDPIPDIHSLFLQFNHEYFWGTLEGVEVRWSPRMTLCAGICCYEGRGGLCSVRLSQPLLKYRPRRDLVETLLHEMIHAYLFVTHNNKDHDAHGPEFLKHMHRINKQTGTRISVYHSFHDEVDLHRKHWWKCNGSCQRRSPFFGIVKRAMNRAPSPRDPWWAQHQATCGGTFIKIKEPEGSVQKKNVKQKTDEVSGAKPGLGDIRNFFSNTSPASKENQRSTNSESLLKQPGVPNIHTMSSSDNCKRGGSSVPSVAPFSGKGYVLGSSVTENKSATTFDSSLRNNSSARPKPMGNLVTKMPPLGNKFSPQRKETKNFQNSVQKKSPLPNSSAKKHPGSVNASSNKTGAFGTALKFSSASGSRTIVIPKNSKATKKITTEESASNLPAVPFKGKGLLLGGGSRTATEGKSVLSSHIVLPSTSSLKREHSRSVSLESGLPKVYDSKGNIKSEKAGSPFVKKEVSSTQPKINMYAVSPEGKNSNSVKSESDHENELGSKFVKCPVCGNMLKDFRINAHLDICLKRVS